MTHNRSPPFPVEDMHNRIFAICQQTWLRELTDRPNIGKCRDELQALLDEENETSIPIRDVGLECFKALEAQKGRGKAAERGGSVIRPKALAE